MKYNSGIASSYFHNSYIYIKIMLITSPMRKPLIKNSNNKMENYMMITAYGFLLQTIKIK